MTTIKVNAKVEIKGCLSCPFHYSRNFDFDETHETHFCSLLGDNNYICDTYCGLVLDDVNRHEVRLKNCPIISVEET